MLHARFVPTILCFVYTLRHFYTFSGTNVLTRCHSATSCFLLFSDSEKLVKKYFRNWMEQKPKSIFYRNEDGVQRGDEEAPQGVRTTPRRGFTLGHARAWCGIPVPQPTLPSCLYKPPEAEILS